jgi:hypothetical protein
MNSTFFNLWSLYSFATKEELLCHRVKISAFQLTAQIGFLKEDYHV